MQSRHGEDAGECKPGPCGLLADDLDQVRNVRFHLSLHIRSRRYMFSRLPRNLVVGDRSEYIGMGSQ